MKHFIFLFFLIISKNLYANENDLIIKAYKDSLNFVKENKINPPLTSYYLSKSSNIAYKITKKYKHQKIRSDIFYYTFISNFILFNKNLNTNKLQIEINNIINKNLISNTDLDFIGNKLKKYYDKNYELLLKAQANNYVHKGSWEPTPPLYANPLYPQFGTLPTEINHDYSILKKLPKKINLNNSQLIEEANYIKNIGGVSSNQRTIDQTSIAYFWAAESGSVTPPGMWILFTLNELKENQFLNNILIMKIVSNALHDAAVITWYLKYSYDLLRPVTYIQKYMNDTQWMPLLKTPPFPSFTSGHSTFSATVSVILDTLFKPSKSLKLSSEGYPDRYYQSYQKAALEAGLSRIYGGIHYPMDNTYGLYIGSEIGCEYVKKYLKIRQCKNNMFYIEKQSFF